MTNISFTLMGVQGTDNTVIGFPFFHRVEPLFDFQIKRISDLVFYYIFLLLLCTALLENLVAMQTQLQLIENQSDAQCSANSYKSQNSCIPLQQVAWQRTA